VGPKIGLDVMTIKDPFPAPACDQTPVFRSVAWSLYQLSHPGSLLKKNCNF